jgi:hypothetical protein
VVVVSVLETRNRLMAVSRTRNDCKHSQFLDHQRKHDMPQYTPGPLYRGLVTF